MFCSKLPSRVQLKSPPATEEREKFPGMAIEKAAPNGDKLVHLLELMFDYMA